MNELQKQERIAALDREFGSEENIRTGRLKYDVYTKRRDAIMRGAPEGDDRLSPQTKKLMTALADEVGGVIKELQRKTDSRIAALERRLAALEAKLANDAGDENE